MSNLPNDMLEVHKEALSTADVARHAFLLVFRQVVCPPKSRPFKNVDFLVLNQVEEFQVEKIEIQ